MNKLLTIMSLLMISNTVFAYEILEKHIANPITKYTNSCDDVVGEAAISGAIAELNYKEEDVARVEVHCKAFTNNKPFGYYVGEITFFIKRK